MSVPTLPTPPAGAVLPPEPPTTAPDVAELSASQCWALMRQSEVCRLAVVVDDRPEIFPVNFVVDRGSVVFRSAAGTKLAASQRLPVALEFDGHDPTGRVWSVVVKGIAHQVRGLHETVDIFDLPLETWHPGQAPSFVRVEPDTVTGRSFEVDARRRRPAAG